VAVNTITNQVEQRHPELLFRADEGVERCYYAGIYGRENRKAKPRLRDRVVELETVASVSRSWGRDRSRQAHEIRRSSEFYPSAHEFAGHVPPCERATRSSEPRRSPNHMGIKAEGAGRADGVSPGPTKRSRTDRAVEIDWSAPGTFNTVSPTVTVPSACKTPTPRTGRRGSPPQTSSNPEAETFRSAPLP
jgi:hypothetical protein